MKNGSKHEKYYYHVHDTDQVDDVDIDFTNFQGKYTFLIVNTFLFETFSEKVRQSLTGIKLLLLFLNGFPVEVQAFSS